MKKLFRICAITVAALSLNSCGITGNPSLGVSETKVLLQKKNFHVVGQAYGQSKAIYVLGMGGLSKKALRANAIDEMSRNAKLTGSQALVNTNVHVSRKMITPLYVEIICDATANVIEFDE
ncbi:MAG: hypothetical protein IK144_12415 [Bacteroidaceae bacterium]|nr:hypothetical protein [Bacteroidaceae bacterium]